MACVRAKLHAVILLSLLQCVESYGQSGAAAYCCICVQLCCAMLTALQHCSLLQYGRILWAVMCGACFALLSCCGQTHRSNGKHTKPLTGVEVMTIMQQPELSRAWHGAA